MVNVGVDYARWQPLPGIENEDSDTLISARLTLERLPMHTENLKARAKRLRAALTQIVNTTITHSQSLELVAREENYPNWDAACASCKRPTPASPQSSVSHIQVSVQRQRQPSVSSVFESDRSAPAELTRLLDPADPRGSLVLIGGLAWQGKTTTARVVVNDLVADVESASEFQYTAESLPSRRGVELIDEVRDGVSALHAVALAAAGVKVVATIHAHKGIERLRVLLRGYRAGELLLDQLLEAGRVKLVQQELFWADATLRQQLLSKRQEEMEAALQGLLRHDPEVWHTPLKPKGGTAEH